MEVISQQRGGLENVSERLIVSRLPGRDSDQI